MAEEAERARSRHRIGLAAAAGAVIVGGLLLGFAVSGNDWTVGSKTLLALADEMTGSTATPDNATAKLVPEEKTKNVSVKSATKSASGQNTKTADSKPASNDKPSAATKAERAASSMLSPDDRIARAMTGAAASRPAQRKVEALISAARDAPGSKAEGGLTAAIPESSAYAPAQDSSLRSEDDAGALEAIQSVDKSDSLPADSTEPQSEKPDVKAAAPFPSGALRDAAATDAVHMRAGPSNKASILTVVPANASVQATRDCPKSWCGVVYKGRRGFVYKDYIRGAKTAEAAPAPKSIQEKPEENRSAAEKSFDQSMRSLLNGGG